MDALTDTDVPMTHSDDHIVNSPLLKMARDRLALEKAAFVPGGQGDPSGGAGGAPPPGGMGGGAPPPGGDPSGGAGGPPGAAPSGGGGAMDPTSIMPMVQQMVQQQMMQQGGAGGAGGKPLAPKIDEKVVLTQIVKLLARVCDHLGIQVPASEMVVGQQDLMGMANATQTGGPMPGMDPNATAGGAGGQQAGAIPPVDGIQPAGAPGMGGMPGAQKGASYRGNGTAFDSQGWVDIGDRAAAIARVRQLQRAA